MKKRIGTKLYDTVTAELIADVGMGLLYRKRTRNREWFLVVDGIILPMTDVEARAALGESSYRENQPPEPTAYMLRVDKETREIINAKADEANMSVTKFMRKIAEEL